MRPRRGLLPLLLCLALAPAGPEAAPATQPTAPATQPTAQAAKPATPAAAPNAKPAPAPPAKNKRKTAAAKKKAPARKVATKRPALAPPVKPPSVEGMDLSFLGSKRACALVLGGGTLADAEQDENAVDLLQVNGNVTSALSDRLAAQGYRVEKSVLFMRDAGERSRTAAVELVRRKCASLVQVGHFLTDQAFGFEVKVLRPVSEASATPQDQWRFHWEVLPFTKRYAYRYTDAAIRAVPVKDLAAEMARDLAQSGLMPKRK
jgi:hypothetical protein